MKQIFNDTAPSLLYKYRDWDNKLHRTIITDQTIWLPSCKNLNDPNDCKTPIYVRKFTKEKKRKIKDIIHERVSIDFPLLSRREKRLKEKSVYKEKNFTNYDLQKEIQSDTIDSRFGIFSLAKNSQISKMWLEYANSNTGFCIGFDINVLFKFEQLKLKLEKDSAIFSLHEVNYVDEYPPWEDTSDEILIEQLTTKLVKYQYEEEYRLIVFNKPNETLKVPKSAMKEIIFGSESSKETREEIIAEVDKNRIDVRFFEIIQKENNSELFRKAIE